VVTLGKNQLLATAGRVLARASKAATQGSDEKPQQIDLTKLGGTLLTSYKSKRTGDRYELWQFSVAGNDHRTIKLIHTDYGETWTAYHPDYHPVFAPASVQQASEKPKSFSFAAYLPHRCCLLCKRDPFVIEKSPSILAFSHFAGVAELADAPDSKSGEGNLMWVRVPPPVLSKSRCFWNHPEAAFFCT
jgi:hypothetical protein